MDPISNQSLSTTTTAEVTFIYGKCQWKIVILSQRPPRDV